MWPAFLKHTNFNHLVKGKDQLTDMMSYAKELPEDPVDGGDGGDGGGVAHSLGEKLLPDLPGKHPCHKFYLPSFIQVLSPRQSSLLRVLLWPAQRVFHLGCPSSV